MYLIIRGEMTVFEEVVSNIYRLKIPFEDLYTSVFLVVAENGNILVDCATYASDVDGYIVPALDKMGMSLQDIKYLVITHNHLDHAGGKDRILQLGSDISVVNCPRPLQLNGITVYEMRGHTSDFIGVLDVRSGALISGDGLQGFGVGRYRTAIASEAEYLKTIDRIRKDERVKFLLFSHAYEPWDKDFIEGRDAVERALDVCKTCVLEKRG